MVMILKHESVSSAGPKKSVINLFFVSTSARISLAKNLFKNTWDDPETSFYCSGDIPD
jgi:hypothetical protein